MYFSKHKQIRSLNTMKANEFELTPLIESTEKPVRKISRCPTKLKEPVQDSGETSDQPRVSGETSQHTKRDNIKVGTLEDSHPRFGPLLRVDQPSLQNTREKAWEHVLKISSQEENSCQEDQQVIKENQEVIKKNQEAIKEHQQVTKEIYLKAIRKVEQEAREIYADKISGVGSDFRWMMIKDGCFFLQLALLILGRSEQLRYPSNDLIFGKKHSKKETKKWIEAMFYVGNQIPLVVLKELMKQKYFQDVIAKEKWDPPPSGLCKKVLYELLVLPALKRNLPNQGNKLQPCDLLHGLQNMVIGDDLSGEDKPDDYIDLEANEDEINDYEANFPITIGDDDDDDQKRKFLNGISSAIEDRKRIFPCATELKRAGITIKKLKRGGFKSIDFKSYYFWAYLYLPAFPVDDNAEMIFRNLNNYEMSQQMGKHKREASSYLRFMSDIIQTTKDVKLLWKNGVIQGDSDGGSDHAEKLPRILIKLSSKDARLTQELHVLRRKIRDYSSPWIHYKGIINLVVFLTLLQTLFALLAYFKPPRP